MVVWYNHAGKCDTLHCRETGCDCENGTASGEPTALVFDACLEPAAKAGPTRDKVTLNGSLKLTPAW